jgi:hypothetical protein
MKRGGFKGSISLTALVAAASLLAEQTVLSTKVGVLTDIHFNMDYQPNITADTYC